jgi:hypothetical protein
VRSKRKCAVAGNPNDLLTAVPNNTFAPRQSLTLVVVHTANVEMSWAHSKP